MFEKINSDKPRMIIARNNLIYLNFYCIFFTKKFYLIHRVLKIFQSKINLFQNNDDSHTINKLTKIFKFFFPNMISIS